jgi:hypothetical protein
MQINSSIKYILNTKIRSWNQETALFYYKNDRTKEEFSEKNLEIENYNNYIIRNQYNNILQIQTHIDLINYDEFDILFKIRKSFKHNRYELINPLIIENKIKTFEYPLAFLDEKIWYPVKSENHDYPEENDEDYIINENDILKFGRKKYEVRKLNINKLSINNSNERISTNDPDNYNISELNKNSKPVFKIDISENQYKIQNENDEEHSEQNKTTENDINKYKVEKSDFVHESSNNKSTHESEGEKSTKTRVINNIELDDSDETNEKCRICFECNSSKENPLLLLCKCHDYIHFECLKLYFMSKLKIVESERGAVTTYIFEKCNCEICLTPYPTRFRIPKFDKIYDLVDISLPSEYDYMILESLDYIKDGKNLKLIHLIQFKEDKIYIGRHTLNDIIDNDISVSRFHSVLKYNRENGYILLENRSEKFGSLVLVRGNIKMRNKAIHFQVGRTYITANLISEERFILIDNYKENQNDKTQMKTKCN